MKWVCKKRIDQCAYLQQGDYLPFARGFGGLVLPEKLELLMACCCCCSAAADWSACLEVFVHFGMS